MMNDDGHIPNGKNRLRGLGWVVYPKTGSRPYRYLQHNGQGAGFGSGLRIYPERLLGLAVLANDTAFPREKILDLAACVNWK